jgi:hypothetical protein
MQMNFVNTFFKKSVLVLYYIYRYTMHVHKFKTGYLVFGYGSQVPTQSWSSHTNVADMRGTLTER